MARKQWLILIIVLSLFAVSGSAGKAAGGQNSDFRMGLETHFLAENGPLLSIASSASVLSTRPTRVRFEGAISQITIPPEGMPEIWIVAGTVVTINADTVIAPPGYRTIVGDWVQVKAIRNGDGSFVAEHVHVRIGATGAVPIEFRGLIESIEAIGDNADRLVVAGIRVIRGPDTQVEGELRVGLVAQVRGDQQANGEVLARWITTSSPETIPTTVEFEGEIREMQNDWWLIALDGERLDDERVVKVWITDAQIEGTPRVGLMAEVRGRQREDGSVSASVIRIEGFNPSQEVHFHGRVASISQDVWVIGADANERTVYLTGDTFVDEGRAPALVGNLAFVAAVQRSDGSFLALRIRLERPG